LDNKSLVGLGQWLNRKWFKCQEKKITMNAILAEVNISEEVLQSEWNEQVKEQTKPMKRKYTLFAFVFLWNCVLIVICYFLGQSKNEGKSAIEELLALTETKKSLQKEIQDILVIIQTILINL
jgi:uncharacterized membrane protein YvbJ